MTELETAEEPALAQKTVTSIKIDTLVPEISITLSLEDFTDFSKSVSLEVKKSGIERFAEKIRQSLFQFENDNISLSEDERYSDAYNYRLSVYYRLTGDFEKEKSCLAKIKNTDDSFYNEQKAKNALLLSSIKEKQNAPAFFKADTAEGMRTYSCTLLAKGEVKKANEEIEKFLESHKDEEESYTLLCQYGLTFFLLNDLKSAAHAFRYVFYNVEPSGEAALFLAFIYRVFFQNEKNPKNKKRLLKKIRYWAKLALILNPSSKTGADFFFKTLFNEETEFFTRFMEKFVTFASTKKDASYYADSMNILGNCYFELGKYYDSLSVLQEICTGSHFTSGIWSNIALCNLKTGNFERALKNSAKAYSKLKDTDSEALIRNVSSIYMDLLYKAKDFSGAIDVFLKNFTQTFVPRTRHEYLKICDIYLSCLLETRKFSIYADYLEFLWQCTKDSPEKTAADIKVCILNAELRLFADIDYNRRALEQCADEYEKLFYEYRKTHKDLPLFFNNLLYARIESGGELQNDILRLFTGNVFSNVYLCATFGLYQARVKHSIEKCTLYYEKALKMLSGNDLKARPALFTELKLKQETELMRLYKDEGNVREAERLKAHIIKKCPEELSFYAERAEKIMTV